MKNFAITAAVIFAITMIGDIAYAQLSPKAPSPTQPLYSECSATSALEKFTAGDFQRISAYQQYLNAKNQVNQYERMNKMIQR